MMLENLKFAFWGTPDVAEKTLAFLIDCGLCPALVITNPDRPQGRGLAVSPTPVKSLALLHNLKILTPEKIDANFIKEFEMMDIDLSIVVAYGQILPIDIINMPKFGTLNIHYSLLPKYRGASPVESALLAGDTETGVSIQKMVQKLDAGDLIGSEKVKINETTTKQELREQLIQTGAELLVKILPDYIDGKIVPQKQNEGDATRCGKIKKEDGLIDPNSNALENYNKYRAFLPWPGIYFFENDKRLKVTSARLENGKFIIEKVIPEGKKEIIYTSK